MSARRLSTALLVLALALAGCGGGSSKKATTPKVDPVVAITTTWEAFFNGAGTVDSHVALLEDGATFKAELTAAAASGQATTLSAKVTKVEVSGTQATVTYNLLNMGQQLLTGATGTAVEVNGAWKVSKATYCQLAKLQKPGAHPGCP